MSMNFDAAKKKVAALTAPHNVVLVGATDRPGAWAARVWSNLSRCGYEGKIYFINPKRTELFGQPCYPDFRSLPETPDHLAVLVPAQAVADALQEGAAAGARSATVFAAGFGEDGDEEGVTRRRELQAVIERTGLAVSGPNVMGNLCGKSRLVTLTNSQTQPPRSGPLALVGQSGGVLIHINLVFLERGITPGYVLCSGNELGLSTPDYIAFFAEEPDVKVIVSYIEGIADVEKFKAACALARKAGKPVIVLKMGQSDAGQQAALAHTGSLAGSTDVFDAVTGELGVIRAESVDEAVELVELLLYTKVPAGRRLGAITLSGAYRGMLLDAADKYGLTFSALAPETDARLASLFTVGAKVSNPLDGGFGVLSSEETYLACVEALDADPNIDMLLLQEELPRSPGNDRTERYASRVEEFVKTRAKKPIAFVSFATHSQSDYSRMLKAQLPSLSFLNEADKSLRVIAKAIRCRELQDLSQSTIVAHRPPDGTAWEIGQKVRDIARGATDSLALNEMQSKELIRAYGIGTPREVLANSAAEAVEAADAIGYPVVLKVVSSGILHKSDVGGVAVNLQSPQDVRLAYKRILDNLAQHGVTSPIEGMLVGRHVGGGLELVLGLHRDPEMGLVVMVGSGGVLLELIKDVAFAAPPLTPDKARDMLSRTRVSRLLQGYRGTKPRDVEAVVQALVALGRIAVDLGDVLESIDINPFVALDEGQGATALDALVIVRNEAGH
ncbi:MAG: putative acetyl-CoA synthetase [Herbaspirillum sp.]|nr:putative acetyl-CoA synthetase [Herbaspirillum sp.]